MAKALAQPADPIALLVGQIRAFSQADRQGRATRARARVLEQRVAAVAAGSSMAQREALFVAAALGDPWNTRPVIGVLRRLLALGVSPDTRTGANSYPNRPGIPMLHCLARSFHHPESRAGERPAAVRANNKRIEDAAIVLVRAGAKLGPHGPNQATPLHDAARFGAARLVAALLARGANVDARDQQGETALFMAARADSPSAVRELVAGGARDSKNRLGETAHDLAIAHGAKRAVAMIARHFGVHRQLAGSAALSTADVTRLLARRAARRHSIRSPFGEPDRAFAKVLRGVKPTKRTVVIVLDGAKLPRLSPTVHRELVTALGEEAHRWLHAEGVETRGYSTGGLRPWFRTAGSKSAARAVVLAADVRARKR